MFRMTAKQVCLALNVRGNRRRNLVILLELLVVSLVENRLQNKREAGNDLIFIGANSAFSLRFTRSDTPFVCRPRAGSVECRMAGRACLSTAGPGHGGAERHDASTRILDHNLWPSPTQQPLRR
jgi:hypothetical protein